jgi:hypothetical protein
MAGSRYRCIAPIKMASACSKCLDPVYSGYADLQEHRSGGEVDRLRDRTHYARGRMFAPGPITAPDSLVDIEPPRPSATGRDLLVEVRAVSVNPVDYKVRSSAAPPPGAAKVIGYDAAGVVVEAGPQASLFRPGNEVFYAGSNIRSGTNAELHLVDERIVGHKPRSLGFAEAAALRAVPDHLGCVC